MVKINLDNYFGKSDQEAKVHVYDSPEDIAATKEFNKKMREVVRDYKYRAAKSRELARRLILDRPR